MLLRLGKGNEDDIRRCAHNTTTFLGHFNLYEQAKFFLGANNLEKVATTLRAHLEETTLSRGKAGRSVQCRWHSLPGGVAKEPIAQQAAFSVQRWKKAKLRESRSV